MPSRFWFEEQNTEGRTERQRVEGGNDGGNSNRHRELPEKLSHDPLNERAGDKYGGKYQSDGDHRSGDLLHRPNRRVPRGKPFLDMVLDRFHDDDGVIND